MLVQVSIDTQRAILMGVEPVRGTVTVDVPLAGLEPHERAWLAARARPSSTQGADAVLGIYVAPATQEAVISAIVTEARAEQERERERIMALLAGAEASERRLTDSEVEAITSCLGAEGVERIDQMRVRREQQIEETVRRIIAGDGIVWTPSWSGAIRVGHNSYMTPRVENGEPLRWVSEARSREEVRAIAMAMEADRAAAAAAAAARDEAAKVAKVARREALVREWGTDLDRARLDEGRLSEDQQSEVLRRGVDLGIPAYEPLDVSFIEHDEGCAGEEGRFNVVEDDDDKPLALDADTFAALTSVRKSAAATLAPWPHTLTVRRHSGFCTDCKESAIRYGVRIRVDLGDGVTVSREYQI